MISVITDLHSFKVKNRTCLFFGTIGILYNLVYLDTSNLSTYMLGLIIPLFILFPLFALNMLGAGDIKLFCSLGALIGLDSILECITYSFLFGLLHAFIIMILRGNFKIRIKKLYTYFISCLMTMSILPYEKANEDIDGRMHFTISIACGAAVTGIL